MGELWGPYCEPLESIECLITGLDWIYRQTFNISRAFVGNWIVDHSASRRCSNYIFFILDLTPRFNGLGQDNCKTTWETLQFGNLVRLISEIWRQDQSCYVCTTFLSMPHKAYMR